MTTPDISTTRRFVDWLAGLPRADPTLVDLVGWYGGDVGSLTEALAASQSDGEVEVWESTGFAPQAFLTPLGAVRSNVRLVDDSTRWEPITQDPETAKSGGSGLPESDEDADDHERSVRNAVDPSTVGSPDDLIRRDDGPERMINGVPVPKVRKLWGMGRVWHAREVEVARRPGPDTSNCPCAGVPFDFDEVCALCSRGGMDVLLPPATEPAAHRVYSPDSAGILAGV